MTGPFDRVPDGARVAIRVTPKASRNAIGGLRDVGEGRMALMVQVTAVPEDGKANAAVIKLLAKAWGVAKGAVTVVAGAGDRNKVLHVAGDADDVMARLVGSVNEPDR